MVSTEAKSCRKYVCLLIMNKGFELWKVSHCKLFFFIVEPVNVVDLVVYTQEHVKLQHGSSGKTMCQGKGLGPFYDCYHRIAKSAPKCALPTTQGLINKDIIGRNCTTYGEIKQFQSDFIGSMYKVQDSCPRPCQIHSYELQVYDSFFCSWMRITVFYITLHYITYPTDFFRLVLKTIYLQVRLMYMNNSLSNSTLIWYMHGSSDIDIFTEIRLYDFAAIIAAVGGSLGLFLGFSCLDSILIFFNWIFPQDWKCSTRMSKVGKCVAFQLWTTTYFIAEYILDSTQKHW